MSGTATNIIPTMPMMKKNAIDSVVNASNTSSDFKLAFRQYVKNKFDDNAKESDLKRILTLIEDDEEDIQV